MLFTRLTELHLEWNELEYIPSDICKLKNLVVLGLSNNRLKELPDSITKLTSLETLLASDNMLVTIPEGKILHIISMLVRYIGTY